MPIQIVCATCGKKLQVGDQYAGRKVSCPGCKTVLTAPGTPAAPAPAASPPPPPPAPKPASAAAAPKPAPKAVPAAPPPPPTPAPVQEEEGDPFSFGSSRAKAAQPEDEDDAPKSKPWKKDSESEDDEPPSKGRAGKKEKAKDHEDEDDFDRPRRSGRGGSREPEKASAGAWSSFGGGCAMAKWGMWIEFLGFAVALVMVGSLIKSAIDHPGGAADKLEDYGGPFMLAPFFLGSAIGTLLVWLGRARMLSIPAGTGAKKVFLGSFLLTLIRLLCVFGAALLIIYAGTMWKTNPSDAAGNMALAMLLWFAGIPFWALADLSNIPGMAIAGGAIPNLGLRRRAGWVTFILQLLVIGYLLVVILTIVAGRDVEWSDLKGGSSSDTDLVTNRRPGTTTTPPRVRSSESSGGKENIKTLVTAAQTIALLLQLAYTALYTSLYAAGARAVAEARDAEDAAQDDEI